VTTTNSTIYYSTNYHGRIMELDLGFSIVDFVVVCIFYVYVANFMDELNG
jgi:hypothetical protein